MRTHTHTNTTLPPQDAANDSSLAGVLLESVAKIMAPLVRLLITHGVTYQMAAELLKRVYVDSGRAHFENDANYPCFSVVDVGISCILYARLR